MVQESIPVFRPFPLLAGQKIFIDGGPRGGDWEVVEVSERKLKLRCPHSGREVEWDRFCYFVEQRTRPWPQKE
jgi:hypothetical protein